MIKYTESKLVLTNISGFDVKVFGKAIIPVSKSLDLFKTITGLTEASVLEALSAPHGELYKKTQVLKELKIDELSLAHLTNSFVDAWNIKASGEAGKDKYLTADEKGNLVWRHINVEDRIQYHTPLFKDKETIGINRAGPNSSGYLSKEDWLLFKGRHTGFRVWQYQDFDNISEVAITLNKFENGQSKFEESWIVDGSAVISLKDKSTFPKTGLLGKTVIVNQHIGKDVVLNHIPSAKPCRVWFLVSLPVGHSIPEKYVQPPRSVSNSRIELLDIFDIDAPGDKQVFGKKTFSNDVNFAKSVKIHENLSGMQSVSTKSLIVETGAASNYSLISNSVGQGEWKPSPVVSSHPPNNYYNGQLWVKEPGFQLYVFDGIRSKWLSVSERVISGVLNTTIASHTYLNTFDNVSMQSGGETLVDNSCLVGLVASCDGSESWKAEVHVNNKLVDGAELHVINGKSVNTSYNINIPKGASIQLFVNGERIAMPKVQAIFKTMY
jgi:hypothetical protein